MRWLLLALPVMAIGGCCCCVPVGTGANQDYRDVSPQRSSNNSAPKSVVAPKDRYDGWELINVGAFIDPYSGTLFETKYFQVDCHWVLGWATRKRVNGGPAPYIVISPVDRKGEYCRFSIDSNLTESNGWTGDLMPGTYTIMCFNLRGPSMFIAMAKHKTLASTEGFNDLLQLGPAFDSQFEANFRMNEIRRLLK